MSGPAGLAAAAARLDAAAAVLVASGAALDDAGAWHSWRGASAEAADRSRGALRRSGDLLAREVTGVAAALREAAVEAVADAAVAGAVAGAGTAAAPGTAAGAAGAALTGVAAAVRSRDRRLAARLDAAGHAGGAPPRSPAPGAAAGPPSLEPEAVAAWWSGLDAPTRAMLATTRPDLVGGLDGIPARDRDAANRRRLGAARDAAEAERRALLASAGSVATPVALAAVGVRLAEVGRRLERLSAVADAAAPPGRALLALDTDRGGVRAAVAQGDVDTARDIGVFTPGFTADVRDLSGRLDTLGRVGALAGPGTAMVAWYDYDAPQWSGLAGRATSVTSDASARAGAPRLSRFLRGLDAARDDDAHVTAVGHSYGTLTTALAVAQAPGVDDAVYLGSPGLGDAPTHVPTWVAEAADDPVADAGWFGPDPNRAPGAVGLSTREAVLPDGRVLQGSSGHDEYLDPGTTSEHNVAAVVGNRSSDAVLDRGIDAGDRLRELFGG